MSVFSRQVVTRQSARPIGSTAVLGLALPLLLGCGGSTPAIHRDLMKPPPKAAPFTAGEALKQFDAAPEGEYRLGEGDAITIQVWDRPDLSVAQVVGPDGAITVPVAGTLKVSGKTRD